MIYDGIWVCVISAFIPITDQSFYRVAVVILNATYRAVFIPIKSSFLVSNLLCAITDTQNKPSLLPFPFNRLD